MSVAKMPDGRWYVYLRYKNWDGETKQHKKTGFATKKAAQQYEIEYKRKKEGSSDMSLQSLYELYIEDKKHRVKASTVFLQESNYKTYIQPYFAVSVDELTLSAIRNWQNQLSGKGLSAALIRSVTTELGAILKFGKKYYNITTIDASMIDKPAKIKKDMNFWTLDDWREIEPNLRADNGVDVMISFLFWTGCRLGEMLALTPADFDFESSAVKIKKTIAKSSAGYIVQDPKTKKSNRTILLPKKIADSVKSYISKLYGIKPNDFIFGGYSACQSQIKREIMRLSNKCGVKRIRIHDLRHSHASLLIEQGLPPLLIADRLGHENVTTTLNIYGHLYPNKQEDILNKLNSILQ